MINGDINAFIEVAQYGHEVFFLYKGQKFFLQGMGPSANGTYDLFLDRFEPPADDYIWVGVGRDHKYPIEEFLNAKIWDGKNFWEVEHEIEWVDC